MQYCLKLTNSQFGTGHKEVKTRLNHVDMKRFKNGTITLLETVFEQCIFLILQYWNVAIKNSLLQEVTHLISDLHISNPEVIAEPHKQPTYGKQKETHELIFSWSSWLVVLLVGA